MPIERPNRIDGERSRRRNGFRDQLRPTLRLAWPVIVAEVGWMLMAVVDTVMVGGIGPEAIGAVSVGGTLPFTAVIFGLGLLLGLDTIVSQAFGARQLEEGRLGLIQALYLSAIVSGPLILAQYLMADSLLAVGISPGVAALAGPYMRVMAWSTPFLMVGGAFRRYLQGIGAVRPIGFALVTANLINWGANWVLIYGHMGLPPLGVVGSGWSTLLARIYMMAVLVGATVLRERGRARPFWRVRLGLDPARLRRLVGLGLPAAIQLTLEIGVFAVATAIAGRLDPTSLAAHQIVLTLSSLTFMVPLGIASAGTVRVGHAIGRNDHRGAADAGWASIVLGAAAMTIAGLVLIAVPRQLASVFTDDPASIAVAMALIRVAACFQLFDGVQVVTTGVLRGAGDTRTAMLGGLAAHWAIGLPIGAWLGLGLGRGVVGLWIGLSAGLVVAGVVVLGAWWRLVRSWDRSAVGQDRQSTVAPLP